MPLAPALVETISQTYGLRQNGAAQAVSERVWRLPTTAGDVAVKVYRAGQQARAFTEATLLAHLQAHPDPAFRVQSLHRTTHGTTLGHGSDHAPILVTRWEHGQFKSHDTFTRTEWHALGAGLAALHDRLDLLEIAGQETLKSRLFAVDGDDLRRNLANELERAGGPQAARMLRDYVDICLRLIDQFHPGSVKTFPADDPQRPIHNDYNQFNYLFDNDLPPVILDWEASIGAPREFEVVRCLNHLPLIAPESARLFVHAYLSVRPLHMRRMAWAVDAACLQHARKGWVIQGWLHEPARFASHLHGSMQMASMLDGARQTLVDFYHRCLDTARTM